MAPLPSNNTGVFYLDYSVSQEDHTLQIRFGPGSSALEAQSVAQAFLTALEPVMYVNTIIGARVRDVGTNVTYPVPWTGDAVYGSGAGPHYTSGLYLDFVGRSIDGRRCRVALFGVNVVADGGDNNYRFDSSTTWVTAALAALESLPETPCSISGLPVNWQQYANCGVNAYWRNHIR